MQFLSRNWRGLAVFALGAATVLAAVLSFIPVQMPVISSS
jgi:hypothetical protein